MRLIFLIIIISIIIIAILGLDRFFEIGIFVWDIVIEIIDELYEQGSKIIDAGMKWQREFINV